jgi:hypothetical protein
MSMADQKNLITKASIADITGGESVRKIAQAHDMLIKTVHAIHPKHLKLSKKSARWLPNLTDKGMKKEQVRTCKAFVAMIAAVP